MIKKVSTQFKYFQPFYFLSKMFLVLRTSTILLYKEFPNSYFNKLLQRLSISYDNSNQLTSYTPALQIKIKKYFRHMKLINHLMPYLCIFSAPTARWRSSSADPYRHPSPLLRGRCFFARRALCLLYRFLRAESYRKGAKSLRASGAIGPK